MWSALKTKHGYNIYCHFGSDLYMIGNLDLCTFTGNKSTRKQENQNDGATLTPLISTPSNPKRITITSLLSIEC